jgi:anti-sigma-K factor RskA
MSGVSEDPDLLAAEYVLGTLDPGEVRVAADRAGRDAAFAARVTAWENRLAPLALLTDPVPPPALLWDRIEAAAGGGAKPANRAAVAWNSVTLWRGATAAGFALAASMAFLMVTRNPPPIVATLLPPGDGGAAIIVEHPAPGQLRFFASAGVSAGAGHDLELWALPEGATRPVSLGVLPPGGREVRLALNVPTKLLVSLEPVGGSPTGLPTGPVVYQGAVGVIAD